MARGGSAALLALGGATMEEKYTEYPINLTIVLKESDVEELEQRRQEAARRGLDLPFPRFLALLLETGSIPHLKRQAAFYISGEIIK